MLFNSAEYLIFFPAVFILYWFIFKKLYKIQNVLIVIVSYIFYGWWDWRFLGLIAFSTIVDYLVGLFLNYSKNPNRRKILLWVSIFVNIGLLGVFKYFNFFVSNLENLFSSIGLQLDYATINIVLPVGISFYTFQTLSYTIDVYRNKLNATKDFIAFAAYVSFFPQLVAGPIERATNLLPQFERKRHFRYDASINGVRQIVWGFFMKVVIADNAAFYVNEIFGNTESYSGSTLLLGAFLFTFQIYGDFAGYSNIAIGTARLFGFNLMQNFAFPYFSRDIAEFWRRWHISLSTWFRDYVYIPLGGSRGSTFEKVRNVFVIFLVSGFWHGAKWTFIFWGLLNAIYFLPLLLLKKNRVNIGIIGLSKFPKPNEIIGVIITFSLTVFAWIFFRAESLNHAWLYIYKMFSSTLFSVPEIIPESILILILFFLVIEWFGRRDRFAIETFGKGMNPVVSWLFLGVIMAITYLFGKFSSNYEFIYFQF